MHHLDRCGEMLGPMLATIHNLHYYVNLMREVREALDAGRFEAWRARADVRALAVTGSIGKTSTKEALAHALQHQAPTHAARASFNNHIGVPLTLSRMPRMTERAVFEIGMNAPGEIAPLSKMVRPHAACVTTVGPVHIEAFADGEAGVAAEKAAIFEGLADDGVAIFNADVAFAAVLEAGARRAGGRA
jgi:UDP-N-acetylmuramoyl-tripeptide--D-alanyl-D-alanine ligase